jgi:hypothetical protein
MNYDYKTRKAFVEHSLGSPITYSDFGGDPFATSKMKSAVGAQAWVGALSISIIDFDNYLRSLEPSVFFRVYRSFLQEISFFIPADSNFLTLHGDLGKFTFLFSCSYQSDLNGLLHYAVEINTFMKMFSQILVDQGIPTFSLGIGLSAGRDLIMKLPEQMSHEQTLLFVRQIGNRSSNLAAEAGQKNQPAILMNQTFFDNVSSFKTDDNHLYSELINYVPTCLTEGRNYGCDLVITDFDDWIEKGMPVLQKEHQ